MIKPMQPQSREQSRWEENLINLISQVLDVDQGDAQGLIEVDKMIELAFKAGYGIDTAGMAIASASASEPGSDKWSSARVRLAVNAGGSSPDQQASIELDAAALQAACAELMCASQRLSEGQRRVVTLSAPIALRHPAGYTARVDLNDTHVVLSLQMEGKHFNSWQIELQLATLWAMVAIAEPHRLFVWGEAEASAAMSMQMLCLDDGPARIVHQAVLRVPVPAAPQTFFDALTGVAGLRIDGVDIDDSTLVGDTLMVTIRPRGEAQRFRFFNQDLGKPIAPDTYAVHSVDGVTVNLELVRRTC